jgi:hypothetical protein
VTGTGVAGLRRFAGRPAAGRPAAGRVAVGQPGPRESGERCQMCRDALGERHGHVVEIDRRSIVCACRACYLLFVSDGAAGGRYRSVPERVRHDPARPLADADWGELQIPVKMAFFFRNSVLGRVVAGYPSPGGVTECELDLAAWDRLAVAYPLLAALTPDVEAIFVNRAALSTESRGFVSKAGAPGTGIGAGASGTGIGAGASGAEHGNEVFLIPIDECYALVGQLRLLWQGFDGGAEAHAALAAFLDGLRRRAVPLTPGER